MERRSRGNAHVTDCRTKHPQLTLQLNLSLAEADHPRHHREHFHHVAALLLGATGPAAGAGLLRWRRTGSRGGGTTATADRAAAVHHAGPPLSESE